MGGGRSGKCEKWRLHKINSETNTGANSGMRLGRGGAGNEKTTLTEEEPDRTDKQMSQGAHTLKRLQKGSV